jgi:hypothetical protein
MNNELQEENNFNALLKDAALTFVYIKEKAKTTLPELEIKEDSIGSFQTIKDIVDMLCESVNKLKTEREEALSALVAKNMLYDAALEQICKLRLK